MNQVVRAQNKLWIHAQNIQAHTDTAEADNFFEPDRSAWRWPRTKPRSTTREASTAVFTSSTTQPKVLDEVGAPASRCMYMVISEKAGTARKGSEEWRVSHWLLFEGRDMRSTDLCNLMEKRDAKADPPSTFATSNVFLRTVPSRHS